MSDCRWNIITQDNVDEYAKITNNIEQKSDIDRVLRHKSFKILDFMVNKNIITYEACVRYAFSQGYHKAFIYINQVYKPSIDMKFIFEDYSKSYIKNYDGNWLHRDFNIAAFEGIFGKVPDNKSKDICYTLKIKLIAAMCTALSYTVSEADIFTFIKSSNIFDNIIDHIKITNPVSNEFICALYSSYNNITKPSIQALSPLLTQPVDNNLLNILLLRSTRTTIRWDMFYISKNLIRHIKAFGIILNDDFPFIRYTRIFGDIIPYVDLTLEMFMSWCIKLMSDNTYRKRIMLCLRKMFKHKPHIVAQLTLEHKDTFKTIAIAHVQSNKHLIKFVYKQFPELQCQ